MSRINTLSRPAAPVAVKITHFSVELLWDASLDQANSEIGIQKGDSRATVIAQLMPPGFGSVPWKTVYTGYGKGSVIESLAAWTQYKFRIQFVAGSISSDWSPEVIYTTLKVPLNADVIHKAILSQDIEALSRILDVSEATIDGLDSLGFTPLMVSAQRGYTDMAHLLIKNGADVNYQNEVGKTALMMASFAGKFSCVKELFRYGAKLNLQDSGGSTALHWACDSRNAELVDFMVNNGANVSIRDVNGRTPLLHLAALNGSRDIAAVLIRHGADMNAVDKNKQTALMIASLNGHGDMVEFLLERNADVTIVNEFGKTAYDMAVSQEKKTVAKHILQYMDQHKIPHR